MPAAKQSLLQRVKSKLRIRFLPAAIFSLFGLLCLKATQFYDPSLLNPFSTVENIPEPITVTRRADQKASLNEEKKTEKIQIQTADKTEKEKPAAAVGAIDPTSGIRADDNMEEEIFDPLELSSSEIDVLKNLRTRRLELEKHEKALNAREKELSIVESQINDKIAKLQTLEKKVKLLLGQFDKEQARKKRGLIKIYENMKPPEAAKILEQLNLVILLEVIENMSQRKVAPILAKMDPVKARIITEQLAQRFKRSSKDIVQ